MAEVGDKLVDLKSLGVVVDAIFTSIENYINQSFGNLFQSMWEAIANLQTNKLNAPEVKGTIGQVLTLKDDQGNTEWKDMPGNVDVVRQSTHHTDYTKDTLEFVTDSTGKVTNVYFMSKQVN